MIYRGVSCRCCRSRVRGSDREAIAQVLNISPSTVRTHLAVIYEKLLVNRFADMVPIGAA